MKRMMLLAAACASLFLTSCKTDNSIRALEAAAALPVASTEYGEVEGYVEDGVNVFKGVRYGADTQPVRFAAPKEPASWAGVKQAKAYGATCPQTPTGNPGGLFTSWAPIPMPAISEDCLFLNVWTPGLADGKKRPIMVWFHGGGFSSGSGSSTVYDGVRLANRGDVVVVTVNHRLNVAGHLYLADYGERFKDSGNTGALDMVLALEWVRDNADAFGGDADNVLIFGESGGGAKVTTLMSMEAAKGLFHRAVVQSGAWLSFIPRDAASAATRKVLNELKLTSANIDDILTMDMGAIRAAAIKARAAGGPVLDGTNITHNSFTPDAPPWSADVPLMLGWNRTESTMLGGAQAPQLFNVTWQSLPAALKQVFPDMDTAAIIAKYRELEPDSNAADVYFHATTDARFMRAHVTQAERKAAQSGAPAYLYLFDYETPVDGGKWRVPHALEIAYVFDNVAKSRSIAGEGEDHQKVANIMADTWIAFARHGKPDHAGIPHWPVYNSETRPVMVFDASPDVVNDARGEQMRLFSGRRMGPNG